MWEISQTLFLLSLRIFLKNIQNLANNYINFLQNVSIFFILWYNYFVEITWKREESMEDYSAKLTAEPFLYTETKIIGRYLLDGEDEQELKKRNIEENLIKHKKVGSVKRVNSPRLDVMDKEMLEEFVCSDIETSKFILLYAIMKTDRLVRDFIVEVYKDKLYMKKEYIEKFDIDNWYEEKCILSQALRERTESTTAKLKQVIMKIMQDSGLVIKEKDRFKIVRPLLKEKFISMLDKNGDMEYAKAIGGLL